LKISITYHPKQSQPDAGAGIEPLAVVQEQHYSLSREVRFGNAWGLAFTSTSSVTADRFTYNSKELVADLDLGWNDYGARMYMSEIGRWSGVDAKSEISRRNSIYNYCYNSPIKFIDPDGMKVEFADDPDKSKRENRRDKREFMKEQRKLNRSSEYARTQWKQLKDSENVHTIHINEKDDKGELVESKVNPKSGYSKDKGVGTNIYINLTDTKSEGIDDKTPIFTLAHEEGHAARFDAGLVSELTKFTISDKDGFIKSIIELDNRKITEEAEASHIENIIRAQVDPTGRKFPLREKYSNILQNYNPITLQPEIKQITINVIKSDYEYYKK
jgi:RHS repeat-associated protein